MDTDMDDANMPPPLNLAPRIEICPHGRSINIPCARCNEEAYLQGQETTRQRVARCLNRCWCGAPLNCEGDCQSFPTAHRNPMFHHRLLQGTFPGDLERTPSGHTNHCEARMRWGDGECECGKVNKTQKKVLERLRGYAVPVCASCGAVAAHAFLGEPVCSFCLTWVSLGLMRGSMPTLREVDDKLESMEYRRYP